MLNAHQLQKGFRHMNRNRSLLIIAVAIASLFVAAGGYGEVTHGEFAQALVRSMGLERELPVSALPRDYTDYLEMLGIEPVDGWEPRDMMSEDDAIITIARAKGFTGRINREDADRFLKDRKITVNADDLASIKAIEEKLRSVIDRRRMKGPLKLSLSGAFEFQFDDNLYLRPKDNSATSDSLFIITPGGDVEYARGDLSLFSDYKVRYITYYEWDKDHINHYLKGGLRYMVNDRLALGINEEFSLRNNPRLDRPITDLYSSGDPIMANDVSVGSRYQLTELVLADVSMRVKTIEYQEHDFNYFVDRNVYQGNGELSYDLPGLTITSLLAGYNVAYGDWKAEDKQNMSHIIYGGVKHKLVEFLTGILKIGYEHRYYFHSKDRNMAYVDGQLYSTFSNIYKVSAEYHLALADSSRDDYKAYLEDSLGIKAEFIFTPTLSAIGDARYSFNKYLEDDNIAYNETENDDNVFDITLELRKELTSWLFASIGYNNRNRNAEFHDEGYADNRYIATVKAVF